MEQVDSGIVYKYIGPDRIDVLDTGRIRFTQLNALNDPFEGAPIMGDYGSELTQRVVRNKTKEFGPNWAPLVKAAVPVLANHFLRQIQDVLSQGFAFLSLSRTRDNLVMWSHYSASHTGLVVGFDASSSFFAPGNNGRRHGLCSVSYSNSRPRIPKEGLNSIGSEEAEAMNRAIFYQKSKHWEYEQELRLLENPQRADVVLDGPGGVPIYLFEFPVACVREIIIGQNADASLAARAAALATANYGNARVLQARTSETRFELEFADYSG